MSDVVRIGSRASKLARTQVTEWLTPIAEQFPGVQFKRRIVFVTTPPRLGGLASPLGRAG